MIAKCSCRNAFQDKTYGAGNRVYNPCGQAASGSQKYRCTVCLATKTFGTAEVKNTPAPKAAKKAEEVVEVKREKTIAKANK